MSSYLFLPRPSMSPRPQQRTLLSIKSAQVCWVPPVITSTSPPTATSSSGRSAGSSPTLAVLP
jgi:hypothetical protein